MTGPATPLVSASAAIDWGIAALALLSTAVGLYIAYMAFRGYRRHESRSMQYLSIGLIMLTAVAFGIAFLRSVFLRVGIVEQRYGSLLLLVAGMFQFAGLAFIAYSLHSRPGR